MKKIKFNIPLITSESIANVKKFLSSRKPLHGPGKNIILIKKKIKNLLNFNNIYLTNSCTSALEICALALSLKKNDEVLLPSFSFITTASSFARVGCKIKYLDIEKENLMPSFNEIKKKVTSKTKVIISLHYQGYSVDYLDKLKVFCKKKKIYLIEDAAQSFGSYFKNKALGSFGDFACFSFHETKNIHAGTGGMLVVNNKKFINKINAIFDKGTNRYLMEQNKIKYYSWIDIGSAFLMSEFMASFLYPQIKNINKIIKKRSHIFKLYKKNLQILNKKHIFLTNIYKYKYNFHAFVILLEKTSREKFLNYLEKHKINAVISYMPLHNSKFGRKFLKNGDILINTDKYINKVVRLPFHNSLSNNQINFITKKIIAFFKK